MGRSPLAAIMASWHCRAKITSLKTVILCISVSTCKSDLLYQLKKTAAWSSFLLPLWLLFLVGPAEVLSLTSLCHSLVLSYLTAAFPFHGLILKSDQLVSSAYCIPNLFNNLACIAGDV